ncbi:hypothetical protein PCE1_002284 [Barthelona sp. PCE]
MQQLRSSLDNFEILSKLGSGSFGTVFKVRRRIDGGIYVLKRISLERSTKIADVTREVHILASLNSPFITRYYDSFVSVDPNTKEEFLNIIIQYCEYGTLSDLIRSRKESRRMLTIDEVWHFFIQTTLGLHYLHGKRVLHRDLKTQNILLTKNLEVKICDFGVSTVLTQSQSFARTVIGTPYYISPEIVENKPYNQKSDTWALGILLYELCCLTYPFKANNQGALLLKILRSNPPALPQPYQSVFGPLLNCLLVKNPSYRASTADILRNPALQTSARRLHIKLPHIKMITHISAEENSLVDADRPKKPRPFSAADLDVLRKELQLDFTSVSKGSGSVRSASSSRGRSPLLMKTERKHRPKSATFHMLAKEATPDKLSFFSPGFELKMKSSTPKRKGSREPSVEKYSRNTPPRSQPLSTNRKKSTHKDDVMLENLLDDILDVKQNDGIHGVRKSLHSEFAMANDHLTLTETVDSLSVSNAFISNEYEDTIIDQLPKIVPHATPVDSDSSDEFDGEQTVNELNMLIIEGKELQEKINKTKSSVFSKIVDRSRFHRIYALYKSAKYAHEENNDVEKGRLENEMTSMLKNEEIGILECIGQLIDDEERNMTIQAQINDIIKSMSM